MFFFGFFGLFRNFGLLSLFDSLSHFGFAHFLVKLFLRFLHRLLHGFSNDFFVGWR